MSSAAADPASRDVCGRGAKALAAAYPATDQGWTASVQDLRAAGNRRHQRHAFERRLRLVSRSDAPEQVFDRDVLALERVAAGLEPGEVEQIADQPLHAVGLVAHNGEAVRRLGIAPQLAHREHLAVGAHRRQRRHQLVRHIGQQDAAGAVGGLQLLIAGSEIGRHAVECGGERRQFVSP